MRGHSELRLAEIQGFQTIMSRMTCAGLSPQPAQPSSKATARRAPLQSNEKGCMQAMRKAVCVHCCLAGSPLCFARQPRTHSWPRSSPTCCSGGMGSTAGTGLPFRAGALQAVAPPELLVTSQRELPTAHQLSSRHHRMTGLERGKHHCKQTGAGSKP